MSRVKDVSPAGTLKDVNDNFDTLAPLIDGNADGR